MRRTPLVSVLFAAFLCSGCATLLAPKTAPISVTSDPSAADVYVDGERQGSTPATADVNPKSEHEIAVRMDGYETMTCRVRPRFEAKRTLLAAVGPVVAIGLGSALATSAANDLRSTTPGISIVILGLLSATVDGATRAYLGPDRDSCHVTLPPERNPGNSGGDGR